MSKLINDFCDINVMVRCDNLFGNTKFITYSNTALGHHSTIDFMITTGPKQILDYAVRDPDINFSDRLCLRLILDQIMRSL